MLIALWSVIFVLSIVVLMKASKVFTLSTEKLGKTLGFSSFLTGVLVLAIATSLPELTTSIFAAARGYTSLVSANVVGSNIANILLILGIATIVMKKVTTDAGLWIKQIPLLLCSTFLMIFLIFDGTVDRWEGVVLFVAYLIYMGHNYELYKTGLWETLKNSFADKKLSPKFLATFILSLALVLVSAHFTVEAVVKISDNLGWIPSLLGGTAVALGTSLPELTTTLMAIRQKNMNLAMGNIIGSSIFNVTLVMAIPSFIAPLNVTLDVMAVGIPFLLLSTLLLVFLSYQKTWARYEGALMIILYLVFIIQFLNPSFS